MYIAVPPVADSTEMPQPDAEGTGQPSPTSDDLNSTWRSTGERDASSPVGTEGGEGQEGVCDECNRRVRACKRSIWTYVSRNRVKYRNPLYSPTSAENHGGEVPGVASSVSEQVPLSSGPPRFSSSSSTPIHGGGTYFTTFVGTSGVTAEAVDFGDDSDEDGEGRGESRTDDAPYESTGEGRRIISSGDYDSGGVEGAVPTQLFVVPSSIPPLNRFPDPADCSSGGGIRGGHAVADDSTPCGDMYSMGPCFEDDSTQPFVPALCRPTRLLRPCFDLQALALWESTHFSGIPMPHTFTAASATYTRGLEVLHREEQSRSKALEGQVRRQERAIEELLEQLQAQKKRTMHLEKELTNAVAVASDSQPMGAMRCVSDDESDGDDYVVFGDAEQQLCRLVGQHEENRSRILSTGLLIEDYMSG